MDEIILKNCTGFDWDSGNRDKNHIKHNVSCNECEQIFFNEPLLLYEDSQHSILETRLYALGMTDDGRELFIVFTIHNQRIRIISTCDMSKKKRQIYEQTKKNT